MRDQKIQQIYQQMIIDVALINEQMDTSTLSLEKSLGCTVDALEKVRQMIESDGFKDDDEEIYFFKHIKPKFQSWYVYTKELHYLIVATPSGPTEILKQYYMNEINIIHRYFSRYAFAYQYYLSSESAKDSEYFLRRRITAFPQGNEYLHFRKNNFSTEMDYLFAKFMGLEMLADYINSKLKIMTIELEDAIVERISGNRARSWIGDKVELVELAYGFFYSKRINGGDIEISEIIQWLETSFNIDLSQAYRIFTDIKRRKRTSFTKFLDEMGECVRSQITSSFMKKSSAIKRVL
ncbi:RteC domain-containing protein [Sphingobacterium oryzagri]|uniref:RteC domain-containing protein n=1 Tax=Sphingobacterium oryzagri TaxID=3025669 RepID=A0ABY7WCX1_9SPHI|nr:RteC domain-containing protein [Sphingobacterium sp. KACC 22765]WDF67043.1 RteC domain-containing protein [Sphingobacterium sp. KACC 22765]